MEFNTGSTVEGTVVGWGLGVTVKTVGAKVVPPMMVVLPPRVSVSVGWRYDRIPQTNSPPEVVEVVVAPIMEVIPPMTLRDWWLA